jgi:hypothetical protein
MDDEDIIAYAEYALGYPLTDVQIIPLSGKQGLFVCRLKAQQGCYIFKAVTRANQRELELSAVLADISPDQVPEVYHYEADKARNLFWLLTRDAGSKRLSDAPAIENYLQAARSLAQLQKAGAENLAALIKIGVPCMQSAQWEEMALRILDELKELQNPMMHSAVPDIENILWSVDLLVRDTESLPLSIIHGDLHAKNIAIRSEEDRGICLLDWGTAYLAPILLGIEELLWPAARYFSKEEEILRIQSAYFRELSSFLGKPSHLTRAAFACRFLVRMALAEQSLTFSMDTYRDQDYLIISAFRNLLRAWQGWCRSSG